MAVFFHFLEISVLCFTGLIVVSILFLLIVLRMPPSSLKKLLTSLLWRLAASVGVGIIAIPLQPIAGVDVVFDFGSMVVLSLYWYGFFEDYFRFRKLR